MPDFGIFRGFNEKLFGDKLVAGQLPTQLGLIGSEEVSDFLLDTYSGAAAAYSLRKLTSTYTGSAIRVRRSSDNTEQDIGFVDGELDTSTLTSFCSGTNGFVKTWYDQSGNARDATQTTAANQPQIVSSGSVITQNGKPAIYFDGSNDVLITGNSLNVNGLSNLYFFTALQTTNSTIYTTDRAVFWINQIGSWGQIYLALSTSQIAIRFGTSQVSNNQLASIPSSTSMRLITMYKNTTTDRADINSTNVINYTSALSTIANTSNILNIGKGTSAYMNMNLSEIIYYPSDQSTNRTGIETNINSHYSIY